MNVGLIVLIVLFFGGRVALIVLSDRKRWAFFQRKGDIQFTGTGYSKEVIYVSGTLDQIVNRAVIAMKRIGANEVNIVDARTIVGWTPISSRGRAAAQQLVIHIQDCDDNGCYIMCCSRPRYADVLYDFGRGKHLLALLLSEMYSSE
jgi:hypothetical protein